MTWKSLLEGQLAENGGPYPKRADIQRALDPAGVSFQQLTRWFQGGGVRGADGGGPIERMLELAQMLGVDEATAMAEIRRRPDDKPAAEDPADTLVRILKIDKAQAEGFLDLDINNEQSRRQAYEAALATLRALASHS